MPATMPEFRMWLCLVAVLLLSSMLEPATCTHTPAPNSHQPENNQHNKCISREMMQNSNEMVKTVYYPATTRETILFPSLRFNCNGHLKNVSLQLQVLNCSLCPLRKESLNTAEVSLWTVSPSGLYIRSGLKPLQIYTPKIVHYTCIVNYNCTVTFYIKHSVEVKPNSILGLTLPGYTIWKIFTSTNINGSNHILTSYRHHGISIPLSEDTQSSLLLEKKCTKDKLEVYTCFVQAGTGHPIISVDFIPGMDEPTNIATTGPSGQPMATDQMSVSTCELALALLSTILSMVVLGTCAGCLLAMFVARKLKKGHIQIGHNRSVANYSRSTCQMPIVPEQDSPEQSGMVRQQESHEQMLSHPLPSQLRQGISMLQPHVLSSINMSYGIGNYETIDFPPAVPEDMCTEARNYGVCGYQNMNGDSTYWMPPACAKTILSQMIERKYVQIPLSAIVEELQIGEGEFGMVYRGKWNLSTGKSLPVAIKMLKSTASNEERVKLLQEAAIMGQFRHPHIVGLYGVAIDILNTKVTLVMDFIENGDLRAHLQGLKESGGGMLETDMVSALLRFCQEIADGMRYLSRKGFIHRDLAARNILLTEDYQCKIADFGMSHELQGFSNYQSKGGRIPLKWTAPEAILYRKYSTKSDVWSYGMVMYEIWSLGRKPFDDFTVDQVIDAVTNGKHLASPAICPGTIYCIMVDCWTMDPNDRPGFVEVFTGLSQLIYDELDASPEIEPEARSLTVPMSKPRKCNSTGDISQFSSPITGFESSHGYAIQDGFSADSVNIIHT